uniref:Uncharacterized protein n=1 Tax=viral metagenome TaxID=1070528 RepID=A0A6M3K3H9_9ZZZZ
MSKYKKSPRIETANLNSDPAYVTWQGNLVDQPTIMKYINGAVDEYKGIQSYERASAGLSSRYGFHNDYSNLATNVSGRPGLSRLDYEAFRPQEALPTKPKDIICRSDEIYQRVGLIKNIVDLMGDFGSQGIRITHPNKTIQKFYRKWFERVNGPERSERFLNNLYRMANVVVRIQTAKLSKKDGRKLEKVVAQPDLKLQKLGIISGEIPIKYIFLHPSVVDVVGGDLASFVGQPQYLLTIPTHLRRIILNPKGAEQKKLVESLPTEIRQAAKTTKQIPLLKDKTRVFHYKKDDWQDWSHPMIYAVMTDINILEKMKLADTAALDGAISNLRIFKLGSLEHKIAPTRAAASKLAEILESNVGGGTMDLVWGPDIELIESKSEVYKFLGAEKFTPHLNNVYAGLGIPPTLTGMFGTSGTTNNFISLKTLMQRLHYGRDRLNDFWSLELEKIQFAMGFRFPGKVEYDIDNLGDEVAEKSLLIQLADRNLISDELLQYRFGHDPDMEKIRLNRENRERDSGSAVPKSGPWYDPQVGVSYKKIALQKGVLTPGQVGLKQDAQKREMRILKSNDEDVPLTTLNPVKTPPLNQVPGRPKNAKDKQKRKTKQFKPQTRAELEIWLNEVHKQIAEILNPIYLKEQNKKNMRFLTAVEMRQIEHIRFSILMSLEPLQTITANTIEKSLNLNITNNFYISYDKCIDNIAQSLGRQLVLAERQQIQSQLYISNLELSGEYDG